MKKYTYNSLYRGQQIIIMCCAKNAKEAAEKFDINTYNVNTYCLKSKIENPFNGIIAYFDSGNLWEKEKNLIRVEMPLDELKKIIDKQKDLEYKEFEKSLGIMKKLILILLAILLTSCAATQPIQKDNQEKHKKVIYYF